MIEEKRDFALSFLYAALNDAQSTIRAIDFKAAAGIAVLGAMLGKILEREQLAAIRSAHWPGIVCACFFGVAAAVSATLAFKTIFPMLNPAENVTFPENLRPAFFLARLTPCRYLRLLSSSPRYAKLAETHEAYLASIQNASPAIIESVLAAEVLKVSFIRQIKTDRLSGFAKILTLTVIVFVMLLWLVPVVPVVAGHPQEHFCVSGDTMIMGAVERR